MKSGLPITLAIGAGCAACSRADFKSMDQELVGLPEPGMYAFDAQRPQRSEAALAQRIHGVASLVAGRTDLALESFGRWVGEGLAKAAATERQQRRWVGAPLAEVPELLVAYNGDVDELTVALDKKNVRQLIELPEMQESRAKDLAAGMFDRMAGSGLIDSRHYARESPSVAATRVGMMPPGGAMKEYVTEHAFTWQRTLNGIPFANAGVRITVDRAGEVVRVRLGEVTVGSLSDVPGGKPTGRGFTFLPAVTAAQIESRFAQDVPNAMSTLKQVLYVAPDGATPEVVEPLYVVSFSRVVQIAGLGAPVMSDVETWGYSLRDGSAAPKRLDGGGKVAPPDPGTPKP